MVWEQKITGHSFSHWKNIQSHCNQGKYNSTHPPLVIAPKLVFHRAWQAAILYSCNFIFPSLEHKKAEKTSCKPRSTNTCSVGTSCLFQLFMTTTPKPCFHLITQLLENLYTSLMRRLLKSDSEKKQTSAA